MKILIVDDEAEVKCLGIIEECSKRGIETEVATTQREAFRKLEKEDNFNAIILDMAFPISKTSDLIDIKGGDRILEELKKRECQIPILVFSKIRVVAEYSNLFEQMRDWDVEEEKSKFFKFLRYTRMFKRKQRFSKASM